MSAQFQPVAPAKANGKGIAGMVLGILAFVPGIFITPFNVILSILALVFGMIGKKEIDASAGTQGGRGMAIAGIVLGWVGIGFALIGLLFIIILGASFLGMADA